jgi:hypothetical protein
VKRAAVAAGALALGLLAGAGLLELALQPLPVHRGIAFQAVDESNPVIRGVPGHKWVHSVGWTLFNPQQGRINNLGFNDPQTFEAGPPVMAVLGDSYVEAMAVPYPETLQGRLRSAVGDCARVYSFGVAGSAASDYPAYLHWAKQHLNVQSAVVVVTLTDLVEGTGPRPGGTWFARQPDGTVELERVDRPAASRLTKTLNASKLYRYVHVNLGFDPVERVKEALAKPAPEPEGEQPPQDHRWTAPAFLDALEAELPAERITLVLDADREAIFNGDEAWTSPEDELLKTEARRRGFTVVDLEQPIRDHYGRGGRKLDFTPLDGHWNGLGHKLAFETVTAAWRRTGFPAACAKDGRA